MGRDRLIEDEKYRRYSLSSLFLIEANIMMTIILIYKMTLILRFSAAILSLRIALLIR
jgi:hypothetical protein